MKSGMPAMVTVFASSDWADVTMAKLLLEAETIPFVTEGEGVQDLFGLGRTLGAFNPLTGPVQIRVEAPDADAALEALLDLRQGST